MWLSKSESPGNNEERWSRVRCATRVNRTYGPALFRRDRKATSPRRAVEADYATVFNLFGGLKVDDVGLRMASKSSRVCVKRYNNKGVQ
eukprot:SAG31_NODE_10745_length_1103_cov_1.374502_2_plen_89_part_00